MHTAELPYLFGENTAVYAPPPATLSQLMPPILDYWISFATAAEPDLNDSNGVTTRESYFPSLLDAIAEFRPKEHDGHSIQLLPQTC
jgi:hypothetical protein